MCFVASEGEHAQYTNTVQNTNYEISLLNPCAVAFIPYDKPITTNLDYHAKPFIPNQMGLTGGRDGQKERITILKPTHTLM